MAARGVLIGLLLGFCWASVEANADRGVEVTQLQESQEEANESRAPRSARDLSVFYALYSGVGIEQLMQVFRQQPEETAQSIFTKLYQDHRLLDLADTQRTDILIMMDSSSSLGSQIFDMGKEFIADLISAIPKTKFSQERVKVAMLSFSASADITQEFNFNYSSLREPIRRAVSRARFHNSRHTHIASALFFARDRLARFSRSQARKIILIATDGKSNDDNIVPLGLTRPCTDLQQDGVQILVVALGDQLDHTKLAVLSSNPDADHIFSVRDASTKEAIITALHAKIRNVS